MGAPRLQCKVFHHFHRCRANTLLCSGAALLSSVLTPRQLGRLPLFTEPPRRCVLKNSRTALRFYSAPRLGVILAHPSQREGGEGILCWINSMSFRRLEKQIERRSDRRQFRKRHLRYRLAATLLISVLVLFVAAAAVLIFYAL